MTFPPATSAATASARTAPPTGTRTTAPNGYNAQANSATLGLCLFFPRGYYASGFEFTVSDVTARFKPGAEIGGIIHVISYDADPVTNPVTNIRFVGDCVTYDRFGTVHVDEYTFDRIHVKFDGSKNIQDPATDAAATSTPAPRTSPAGRSWSTTWTLADPTTTPPSLSTTTPRTC